MRSIAIRHGDRDALLVDVKTDDRQRALDGANFVCYELRNMLSRDIDELNAAFHALLLRLNLARLDLWSDKLVGIGYLDLHAMSFAENKPDHTLAEMREFLQVPQSTLTSIIDRLEKRELVRRAIHPTDKRSYLIELTDKGLEVQREHHRVEKLLMRKILDALPSASERAQFVSLARKIASKI